MAADTLYKAVLLEHFHHPRNKGSLQDADLVRRGSNPRCGDDIEVGLFMQGDRLERVKFRGRGCSLCIASASLMTEAVRGHHRGEARSLCERIQLWFAQEKDDADGAELPPDLEALLAVRDYPARRRCVLLSWQALSDALAAL